MWSYPAWTHQQLQPAHCGHAAQRSCGRRRSWMDADVKPWTHSRHAPPTWSVNTHNHSLTLQLTSHTLTESGFVANSKYKFKYISRTFKHPNCIFQAPKLSTKSHILDADIQNLDCNLTLKQAKWNQILFPSTGDMHTSACFKIVDKCKISKFARLKFKDFSRIFKYFQAPYLFSSTFKSL